MYGLDVLIQKVLLLSLAVLMGVIMQKTGKITGSAGKMLSNLVIYLCQPAMIIYSFLDVKFSANVIYTAIFVFVLATLFHFMYFAISMLFFNKAPEKQKTILKFSTIFTNAGFMGIPLIAELFGSEAAIYATFYVVSFNVLCWTLGCYIYTNDKRYISVKMMLWNPATVPTYIGILFFVLSGFVTRPDAIAPLWNDFIVPLFKNDLLFLFKSCVIPLSMVMIGVRLAQNNIKTLFKDKNLYIIVLLRLIAIPLLIALILKLISLAGIFPENVMSDGAAVLVISSATPVAAMASIFAERYDGDVVYASKLVSATTIISILTMPLIAILLLQFNI